jgi:hypothetical protein
VSTIEIVVVVLVALVLLAAVVFAVAQARSRRRLRERFGPEYDRTVERSDGRRAAEQELVERAERREQLDIRPLPEGERRAFAERWRTAQEDFVDRPAHAVRQADLLVEQVMARRGYPVEDVEQMTRDVSVDHAQVVEDYRGAHEISQLNERGQATTEQLRQAMVHYRALFSELLADGQDVSPSGVDAPAHDHYRHRDGGYEPSYDRPPGHEREARHRP